MEHADLDRGLDDGPGADSVHHQFLLEHQARRKADDNPWDATTLEWAAPSPPPHGNFAVTPVAYRGPYEYSLPGREKDFTMQNEPMRESDRRAYEAAAAAVH